MATLTVRPRASKMLEAGLHYKIVLPHAPSCLSHLLSLDLWSWKTLRNVSVKMGIAYQQVNLWHSQIEIKH